MSRWMRRIKNILLPGTKNPIDQYNSLQNNKCSLYGEKDEMVNDIISECRNLVQKEYKTRHDLVGKVIHWELCKRLKFDHTIKWHMHKLESVLENETQTILLFRNNRLSNPSQKTRLSAN